jgi:hypothetical protein
VEVKDGKARSQAIIRFVVAILLAGSGIAMVMAWAPTSIDRSNDFVAPEQDPAPLQSGAHPRLKCGECGVVESMREIALPIPSPTAATLGKFPGRYPQEQPPAAARRYEVTVRMTDGSSRIFMDPSPERWHSGSRVVIIGGETPVN